MLFWSIGYQEIERLEVEILSAPDNNEVYDWVSARARINVGGFKGDTQLMICASEIKRFTEELDSLYRDLKGFAEFKTIENQLYLKLNVDYQGHIYMEGFLRDDAVGFGKSNKLSFEIEFDQTYLARTLSELKKTVTELSKMKKNEAIEFESI